MVLRALSSRREAEGAPRVRNEAGRGEALFGRDTGQGLGRVRSPEDLKEGVEEEMCVRRESGTGRCL